MIQSAEQFYRQAHYTLSAHKLSQLPVDQGYEVAFAGRSNAGKSSSINRLCRQKALARTSKTPGRTQQMVIFELDQDRRLVDLPGYGFARTPQKLRDHWQRTLPAYIESRQALQGIILLVDIRHPLKEFDRAMLNWCNAMQLPVHVLLTKADKLSRNEAKKNMFKVQATLEKRQTLQLFSATKSIGLDDLYSILDLWFERIKNPDD